MPTDPQGSAVPRSRLRKFVRAVELPVLAVAPGCFAACWIAGVVGFWLWLLGVTSALLAHWVWPPCLSLTQGRRRRRATS